MRPDGEVDVGVLARDAADVEVDAPAAEEPALEAFAIEQRTELAQGGEVGLGSGALDQVEPPLSLDAQTARSRRSITAR